MALTIMKETLMLIKNKSREQKNAEAEVAKFKKELGPFVVAAETTRMPMIFTDAKVASNPIIFANDSFLRLTSYGRKEILGQSFGQLLMDQSKPESLARIRTAFEDSSENDSEICCHRKNGSVFWVSMLVSPVLDRGGNIVQHFASFLDITSRRKEISDLHFLLDELNHRTQNTLATVLAIAAQTLHGVVNREVIEIFEGRIMALSKAHSLLGRKDWSWVSLHDVLDRILQPFGLHDLRFPRFLIKGNEIRLQPKAALTLAMVFHELATNAAKYGALSDNKGRIEIVWDIQATPQGDWIHLRWQESNGPPVTTPLRKGFGSRLIKEGLAAELGGEVSLDYAAAGVICRIDMPILEEVKNHE